MTTVDLTDMEITAPAPIEIVHEGVPMLGAEEARQIVKNINGRFEQSRKDLIELHDREGWKALGYDNWRACVEAEFQQSAAYLYRQLAAAKIEQLIESPIGEIPESHLRPLAKAKINTQETIKRALTRADQLAGDSPRTAKHIAQAAQEIAHPDLPPEFAIVQRRFAAHDQTLASTWDGVTRRYVLRKEGGAGVVMTWPDVLSTLQHAEEVPSPDPAAPAFRMTCPTCGETILNGIWGDRKECGSCYHARQQAFVPAGDPLPSKLLTLALADLDATLPKDLSDAGYYWQSATPPTIRHNDGWQADAPTVDRALEIARDRETAQRADDDEPIPVFPGLNKAERKQLLRETKQFIESGMHRTYPLIGKALRIAARIALDVEA